MQIAPCRLRVAPIQGTQGCSGASGATPVACDLTEHRSEQEFQTVDIQSVGWIARRKDSTDVSPQRFDPRRAGRPSERRKDGPRSRCASALHRGCIRSSLGTVASRIISGWTQPGRPRTCDAGWRIGTASASDRRNGLAWRVETHGWPHLASRRCPSIESRRSYSHRENRVRRVA